MKRKFLLLITAIVSSALIFPQTSIALDSSSNAVDVGFRKVLDEYSNSLEKIYYSPKKSRSKYKIPFSSYDQIDDGLISTNVKVNTKILNIKKTVDGYNLHVDVSLSSDLKPEPGVKIYLGGKLVDSMHSSWTDEHIMHLSNDRSSSSYAITNDEVVDPANVNTSFASSSNSPLINDKTFKTPALLDRSKASFDSSKQNLIKSRSKSFNNSSGFDYIKAINYADKWTKVDKMNPAYPIFNSNCANFVSQSIHEGGMEEIPKLWDYSTSIPSLTTASWMNANSNYYYMKHYTNSFTSLANVWDAWEGSLLYVDWKSDGKIDHTMIVVGVVVKDNKANPVIDQKSNNRHRITLTQSLKYAHKYYNNMTWYGLQYRYN